MRREKRRPRRVRPYGALLLMASLLQRSAAGFKGGRGSNALPRPPISSPDGSHDDNNNNNNNNNGHNYHGNEDGVAQPGGGGGRGSQQYHLSRSVKESLLERRSSTGGRAALSGGVQGLGGVSRAGDSRVEAFLAAGRMPVDRRAALEHRAGAGSTGEGTSASFDPQQYRQQQQRQQGQGIALQEPWNNANSYDENVYGNDHGMDHERAGSTAADAGMMSEGVPGSHPTPRTPLQEQAYQNKVRQQRTRIHGQAVGTQSPSSSLFRRAGSGSVFFIFFVMVCRSLNHYEYAEQLMGALRAVSMVPAVSVFLGNLVCLCLSLVQVTTNRQKARMKTMLTIDAACEGLLLVYNMLLLLGGTSGLVSKEEFVSRILTNVLFISLCFTFAKARWVAEGAF